MNPGRIKKWIGENKSWLFSGIVVFALGAISSTIKEHWSLLKQIITVPVWGIGTIILVSIGIVGLVFSRKERRLTATNLSLTDKLQAIEIKQNGVDEIDPLTGLYNLRKLDKFFEKELPEFTKEKKEVWAAILDINQLKKKTENASILAGSDILEKLGQLWTTRDPKDLILRWGGDEFMIISPNSNEDEITGFVERLQKKAADYNFYVSGEDKPIKISVAAGISKWNKDDNSRTFQSRLGKALREAKDEYAKIPESAPESEKSRFCIL